VAAARNIDLRIDLPASAGRVLGDADRLQQVVWNLLSNAVKFTPEGGWVAVRLRRSGSRLVLRVRDNGKGIAADFLPQVFERFRREDSSARRGEEGLGLGLALVRHLVHLHGGDIEAASAGPGRGACFTLRLPSHDAGAPPAPAAEPAADPAAGLEGTAPGRLAGLHLLLVEDRTETRESLAALLEQAGAGVTAFGSGTEAVDWLRHAPTRPQLLLCDLAMPGEDGCATLRRLRALGPGLGDLPAVSLSACGRSATRREALAAGFELHLGKPVEADALIAAVLSLLPPARDPGRPAPRRSTSVSQGGRH
jgi:CheY-like chemotaxis protein